MKEVRIGCGAGFQFDRVEPAYEVIKAGVDYLGWECLAERSLASKTREVLQGKPGYDSMLTERLEPVMKLAQEKGTKLITNMGAYDPQGAAKVVLALASSLGIKYKVAVITGDKVLDYVLQTKPQTIGIENLDWKNVVSASAYLGADVIADALKTSADLIISGRTTDSALFAGPLIHEFSWKKDEWNKLVIGILAGHLLECAGQVTGGYYACPGKKEVPGLERLGFPIAIVDEKGGIVITKPEGSGGLVTEDTIKEQLIYEVHDPSNYMTPDVIADFSNVTVQEIGENKVKVTGACGKPRPDTLKVSIGYKAGWFGEGKIYYAGHDALGRAQLAANIVADRLKLIELSSKLNDVRISIIGYNELHGLGKKEPYEVGVRLAVKAEDEDTADKAAREVISLYTNGPYGGSGVEIKTKQMIGLASAFIPRDAVKPNIEVISND